MITTRGHGIVAIVSIRLFDRIAASGAAAMLDVNDRVVWHEDDRGLVALTQWRSGDRSASGFAAYDDTATSTAGEHPMTMLAKFFRLFAASVVPGGGFLLGEWSPATALTLYWVDTLVGAFAMGVRIGLHRHWTKVSGHDRPQLGVTLAVSTSDEEMTPVVFKSFLAEFLLTSVAFTVAHGVFLTVVLGFMSARADADQVRQGAIAILVCHALSLSFDARRLDSWPFARLKEQAERIMGRVVFIHMLILGGMWFSMTRNTPGSFLTFFVWLKFISDIGSLLPQWRPQQEPPRWLAAVMKRFPKQRGESFEEHWRRTRAKEMLQASEDERVKPVQAEDEPVKPMKVEDEPVKPAKVEHQRVKRMKKARAKRRGRG